MEPPRVLALRSASSLGFGYTSFSRDGSNKLDRTLTVGDTVFDVDTKIDTEVELDFLQLDYRWSAINDGKTRPASRSASAPTGSALRSPARGP